MQYFGQKSLQTITLTPLSSFMDYLAQLINWKNSNTPPGSCEGEAWINEEDGKLFFTTFSSLQLHIIYHIFRLWQFQEFFSMTRTMFSQSRSEQFLKQNTIAQSWKLFFHFMQILIYFFFYFAGVDYMHPDLINNYVSHQFIFLQYHVTHYRIHYKAQKSLQKSSCI